MGWLPIDRSSSFPASQFLLQFLVLCLLVHENLSHHFDDNFLDGILNGDHRHPLIFRNYRYNVSSRRDSRIYYKCSLFRKQCKARLVVDLKSKRIEPTSAPHSHCAQAHNMPTAKRPLYSNLNPCDCCQLQRAASNLSTQRTSPPKS